MNLKNRLRDIETDCRDGFHDLAPPNRRGLNSTHIRGTHVPVEEPSTASISDIVGRPQLINDDRAFPIAQIRTLSSLDDLLSLLAACMRPNGPPALN
jgi:hypothetical protein